MPEADFLIHFLSEILRVAANAHVCSHLFL
nr:MAG TPA_asm: hypothetical protein [Caudoviricetes sp.]